MSKTFRSLRIPNFRWYAAASLFANTAMWMQRIDQDWLAVKLTHRGTAVGVTTALQFLPILLVGPFAGLLADHMQRRRLLVLTCATMAAPALLLGLFIVSGSVDVWRIYGCALLLGVASSVDAPARMAYLRELLGKEDLVNALGLSQVNFHTSRIIGPAVAGFLIASSGIATAFFAVAASFLVATAMLFRIRPIERAADQFDGRAPPPKGLGGAFGQLIRQPGLVAVILLAATVSAFALNFQVELTIMATQLFKLHASGFGALTSMMALGSITGALLVARLERPSYAVVFTTASLLGLAYLIASRATDPMTFGLALTPIGLFSNMFLSTSNAVVQLRSDVRLQGRITGLYMAATNALVPAGAIAIGAAADTWSPRAPLVVAGALCLGGGLATFTVLIALGVIAWEQGRMIDADPTIDRPPDTRTPPPVPAASGAPDRDGIGVDHSPRT